MSTVSEAASTGRHDHIQHDNQTYDQRPEAELVDLWEQNGGSKHRNSDYDSLLMFPINGPAIEASPEDNEKRRKSNGERRRQFRSWLWELGACFLSLASISAVIAALYVENGKPLDQWTWSIGPTAVVSFITAIAKSSMLVAVSEVLGQLKWQHFYGETHPLIDLQVFDAAGRGPYGAAEFLRRKHVKTWLASLAAVITIAALLIDPFMQLVFVFPALSKHESDIYGFFNQTQTYDPHGYTFDAHMTGFSASSVDALMQAAIIRAVSDQSKPPAAVCPTGNCTWPQVPTLGICADCTNVTQHVNVSCPGPTMANKGQYQCDYGMPSGRNLSAFMFKAGATGDYFPTRWNSSAVASGNSSPGNGSEVATLARIEAMQLKEDFDYGNVDISSVLRRPIAWTCTFVLCAKTYETLSMTNGEVSASEPTENFMILTGNITNISAPVGGGLYGLSFIQGLRVNHSSSPASTHWINTADYANLGNYLAELFSTGWGSRGFGASNQVAQATAPNLGWALSEVEDLAQTVHNIAESMTEVVRNSRNSTSVAGEAFRTRTYIEVQWGWVALPLTLTILSLLMATFMAVRKHGSNLPPWKNSGLVLLFHGVDGWAPEGEAMRTCSALEKEAEEVSVTLPKDSHDLTFIRN
ncbi:hypothetical protein F4779DRAFT_592391 [Xylariaceae sp. FL0662B]|nr:hypothetical protein F4779DRAFT_592391 [Xylariaceae sp. FL0662B]